ncbi:hypothetical protein OPV22_014131 [Ensete ventricosum]|uniref:Uncharacterized protein n=1 Tax=Ensete ventricosum TaxID=4639 RepID=A0AAV8R6Z6_ENSVE|nr:hypothetical protein OPV22_014131 [Ensete ventricosum]
MEDSGDRKRRRDEAEEQESQEAKRLRDDLFLHVHDDDAEAGDEDIASVMKSLEEEIALSSPPPPPPPTRALVKTDQPDLGFLLEASDDELGLPPPALSSSDDGGEVPAADDPAAEGVAVEGVVFGQIWGLDDDISGYDGFDFGIGPDDRVVATEAAEDGVLYDAGLFDYADVLFAPSDFPDLSWTPTV